MTKRNNATSNNTRKKAAQQVVVVTDKRVTPVALTPTQKAAALAAKQAELDAKRAAVTQTQLTYNIKLCLT